MGRKKQNNRDEESGPVATVAGGKSKKKGFVIADDEYSFEPELPEDAVVPDEKVIKKKGKKGPSKKMEPMSDDELKHDIGGEDEEEEDAPAIKFAGKKKGKGKKVGNNSTFSASSFGLLGGDEDDGETNDNDEEDEEAFSGNKKPSKSKKKSGGFSSAFDLLDEEEDNKDQDESSKEEDEDVQISFTGKKKKSSKESKKASVNSVLDGGHNEDEEQDEVIAFSGKKKPSKSKQSGGKSSSAFDLLDGDEESKDLDESPKDEDEDFKISFTGKKKKSSKGSKKAFESLMSEEGNDNEDASVSKFGDDKASGGDDQEEDGSTVTFSGKKKPSKKKNTSSNSAIEDDAPVPPSVDVTKLDQHQDDSKTKMPTNEGVTETSKNKKKKKKGSKTVQEEEDLDKILSEFGGAPTVSDKVSTPGENVQNQSESVEATADKEAEEEGPAETVTSKKKKKKKDKEKEKKAAVVEENQEESKAVASSKLAGKKVPKHVREMQERLAKLKEAEEKKKREEEEKLRKEEEERLRLEELERLAEEKKRLKKEREKEKLLKKKQEGKLLTGKQKEEARRLEAMRKQILANASSLQLPTGEGVDAPSKRPIYQKKKPKAHTQSNGATTSENVESTVSKETQKENASELYTVEAENDDEVETLNTNDKSEVTEENAVEDEGEEEDDDDEEWDAKSWDDADLKLPGISTFADEEADLEPESSVRKEIKDVHSAALNVDLPSAVTKPVGSTEKAAPVMPHRSDNSEAKTKTYEGEVANKNSKKEVVQKVAPKSDDTPAPIGQNLRSPICCIMGHVDAGKTKLLDCIRGTNVQEGEAGGITQQIGATYFPAENIRERTKELKADAKLNVPGLLVIDTPGHESFTNLRSRGSGLCDIAILVVDIMHGLEPQTIESLNLLKMRNTEFIIALNKVDRLYGWKKCANAPITKAMKQQSKDVLLEFNTRLTQVVTQFKEQGLNTELYYKNKEMGETFSIVPTSAISGEGIPDLLLLLVQWAQKTMVKRLTYTEEVQCTVLEVKVVEGHGTTIDVVLVNGVLHEGDQIVVCGLQGPIVTSIRALLTPHPMKEIRVKGAYIHHKEIKAAQGIKITAQGLEHAIAGTSLYVIGPQDDLEQIKEAAMEDMESVLSRIDRSGEGVYVQASTLGSMEALLEFLKTPAVNIPVSGISIGPVHKKDVIKASVMLEKKKEYATILAFDVKVTQEARELADELGVKIFIADIIYHLFDQFKAYIDNLKEEKKREAADEAVFPCVLKIIPNCVFNKKDPIVLGVDVLEGIVKVGTPICVPQREFIEIGRIASVENNHKAVDYAKKGTKVAIKILGSNPEEQQKMFGRHFEIEDELVSKISRSSLDALKEHYADDLSVEEKRLLFKLKKLFKIP